MSCFGCPFVRTQHAGCVCQVAVAQGLVQMSAGFLTQKSASGTTLCLRCMGCRQFCDEVAVATEAGFSHSGVHSSLMLYGSPKSHVRTGLALQLPSDESAAVSTLLQLRDGESLTVRRRAGAAGTAGAGDVASRDPFSTLAPGRAPPLALSSTGGSAPAPSAPPLPLAPAAAVRPPDFTNSPAGGLSMTRVAVILGLKPWTLDLRVQSKARRGCLAHLCRHSAGSKFSWFKLSCCEGRILCHRCDSASLNFSGRK